MKKRLHVIALALALVFASAGFAAPAKTIKVKESAARKAAIKKCNDDYRAALKADKTKKGKERKEADAAARQTRKQCIADAPK
jgi:Skp family chaperone for outer membrane proteins